MNTLCMYCGANPPDDKMLTVRVAMEKKYWPYRWKYIGYCCYECRDQGKEIEYESEEKAAEAATLGRA